MYGMFTTNLSSPSSAETDPQFNALAGLIRRLQQQSTSNPARLAQVDQYVDALLSQLPDNAAPTSGSGGSGGSGGVGRVNNTRSITYRSSSQAKSASPEDDASDATGSAIEVEPAVPATRSSRRGRARSASARAQNLIDSFGSFEADDAEMSGLAGAGADTDADEPGAEDGLRRGYSDDAGSGSGKRRRVYDVKLDRRAVQRHMKALEELPDPDSADVTPEQQRALRRQVRLIKNRQSAQLSRQRKKLYVEQLERRNEELEQHAKSLADELDRVKAQLRDAQLTNDRLRQLFASPMMLAGIIMKHMQAADAPHDGAQQTAQQFLDLLPTDAASEVMGLAARSMSTAASAAPSSNSSAHSSSTSAAAALAGGGRGASRGGARSMLASNKPLRRSVAKNLADVEEEAPRLLLELRSPR